MDLGDQICESFRMPGPEFSLRTATLDDLPALERIETAVHVAPWSRSGFEAELAKPYSRTLAMTDDETDSILVGYIVFWMLMEECQILNVAVDSSYRRLGMAKQMIRKAIDLALHEGLKRAVLNVRKSNEVAVQLYQSVNFTIEHIRKGFYSNGEDAYEMVLDLTSSVVLEF